MRDCNTVYLIRHAEQSSVTGSHIHLTNLYSTSWKGPTLELIIQDYPKTQHQFCKSCSIQNNQYFFSIKEKSFENSSVNINMEDIEKKPASKVSANDLLDSLLVASLLPLPFFTFHRDMDMHFGGVFLVNHAELLGRDQVLRLSNFEKLIKKTRKWLTLYVGL